ncbi:hypothetical protein M427DRAFT_306437 [Gonapodya prolifera JEL478]|uniref:Uncharacterized protein n=1 Tax=Gonapodya prolifera (strain JEL478) TaxID=1344416 RepID=A0A139AGL9_GONPJ|nr:hypothetical protein M427DRAFT_306437 [Gonapodya prolifera JEL478]|eukprot:KXS15961.1 hypothetical protein M427DRAFT_306437 [Gonapodya prolifera JEL478]
MMGHLSSCEFLLRVNPLRNARAGTFLALVERETVGDSQEFQSHLCSSPCSRVLGTSLGERVDLPSRCHAACTTRSRKTPREGMTWSRASCHGVEEGEGCRVSDVLKYAAFALLPCCEST